MHILFHFNMCIYYFAHLLIIVNVDVNKVKRAALEQHEFPFWSRVVNASLVLAHSFYWKTYLLDSLLGYTSIQKSTVTGNHIVFQTWTKGTKPSCFLSCQVFWLYLIFLHNQEVTATFVFCHCSKHRHNKLWQPDGDEYSLEGLQASAASDQIPQFSSLHPDQEETAWGHGGASASPCCGEEPTDHLNYNYYFRRLSDTALDSEPSTPVRGPPLLGMERVFIEIEDVERDALLDDEGIPMAHLALPGEGTAAQTCGRLEPIEDMRLRLEFSTVEEEDEEEAQKEEAEMAALARGEETQREDESLANSNRFNNENANNSNRLAGKRSCPSGFDVSMTS